MRLTYRREVDEGAGVCGTTFFFVGVVLTAAACGISALVTSKINTSRQHIRDLVSTIQHPAKRHAGDEDLQVMARLLRDLAGLEQGGYREFVRMRYGKPFDPERDVAELRDAWEHVGDTTEGSSGLVRQALAGEEIAGEHLPRFISTWRTVGLIATIGWAISSIFFWFMVCWWDGVFTGHHPYSGLQWKTSVVGYVFLVGCFPGTLVNAAFVGLFYVVYGIVRLCEMPEPQERVAAGGDCAAAVVPVAAAEVPAGAPSAGTQADLETPPAETEEPDTDPGDPRTRRPKHVGAMIAEYVAAREQTFARFVQLLAKANVRRYEATKTALAMAAKALEDARRAYAVVNARYQRCRALCRTDLERSDIRRLYDGLWEHPRIRGVHIADGDCVCIHPETTVISDGRARYEIGDFALKISPGDGTFYAHAIRQTSSERAHPFVTPQGYVCFGAAASAGLSQFVDEIDYLGLVDFALVMMTKPSAEMKTYWRPLS